jgi:hypothetical protein
MSKIIEASLVLISSIAITALIMVVVFPVHALGVAIPATAADGVQPAVYVEGARSCPATGKITGECPYLAQRSSAVSCPYLAALAAASGCPALSERDSATACPYADGHELPDPRVKIAQAKVEPTVQSL